MVRSSSSSSRKVCPPNKFSLFSGCISWEICLACFFLCALLFICFLLISTPQLPRDTKKGDIIEEKRDTAINLALSKNFMNPSNIPKNIHSKINDNQNSYNRVSELFDANDSYRSPHEGTGTPGYILG